MEYERIENNGIKLYRKKYGMEKYDKHEQYYLDDKKIEAKKGNTLIYINYGPKYYREGEFDDWYGVQDEYKLIEKGKKFERLEDTEIEIIYSADLDSETNRKLLVANLNANFYFIEEHLEDVVECMGGFEGFKKLVEDIYHRAEEVNDNMCRSLDEYFDEYEEEYKKIQNKNKGSKDLYEKIGLEEKSKDTELSGEIKESKELDKKIERAEELLSEYEKQDPEQNKEGQTQADS